jgi:type II secretory pathway component PulJ
LLKRPKDERGYLLIEALIASVILSVGIVALLGAFHRSLQVARFSAKHAAALSIIEQRLMELESGLPEYGIPMPEDSEAAAQGFKIQIEPVDTEGPLSELRMTVSWEDAERRSTVSLTTLALESSP